MAESAPPLFCTSYDRWIERKSFFCIQKWALFLWQIQEIPSVFSLFSLFSVDSGDQKIKTFCTFFGFSAFGATYITWNGVTIIGQLRTTTGAKRPPFWRAAFWNWATKLQITTTTGAKRPPFWRLQITTTTERPSFCRQHITTTTGAKRPPFWRQNNGSFLDHWEQQLRARSGRLFEGKIMGLLWTSGNHN
jgi:hypothetical protein